MTDTPRVTVWNECRHERSEEEVAKIYPEGFTVLWRHSGMMASRSGLLPSTSHGLTEEVLDATDVLLWWGGHIAHDEVVEGVHERVLAGMGLIVLHSGHFSKIFKRLMGTSCDLKWRHDDRGRLWVVAPGHPIVEGLGEYIELEEEMYGEPFDLSQPEELNFVSWFGGGEVFRSGCCYKRGRGRIFYFRPGHETNTSYHNSDVRRVIRTAVYWAAPTPGQVPAYGHTEPLE